MEVVSWTSQSGRYNEFGVSDLWKSNNIEMSLSERHVVILTTSKGVSISDHRHVTVSFAEQIAKDALSTPQGFASIAIAGIEPVGPSDEIGWHLVDAVVVSKDDFRDRYYDGAEDDGSFDRLVTSLLRKCGALHFVHINIFE